MMQTTITVDVGLIVTALAPTIAIITAGLFARRAAKAAAVVLADQTAKLEQQAAKIEQVRTLVDGASSLTKKNLLESMQSRVTLLNRLKKGNGSSTDDADIASLETQIAALKQEIQAHEEAEAAVAKAEAAKMQEQATP